MQVCIEALFHHRHERHQINRLAESLGWRGLRAESMLPLAESGLFSCLRIGRDVVLGGKKSRRVKNVNARTKLDGTHALRIGRRPSRAIGERRKS